MLTDLRPCFEPLPLFILAVYQAFITSTQHQNLALSLYLIAPTVSFMISSFLPEWRVQVGRDNVILVNLWMMERVMIPMTVILAVGFADSSVGVAIAAVFISHAGHLFPWVPYALFISFLVINLVDHPQSRVIEDTVAIDSKYNHEIQWVIYNSIFFFVLGFKRDDINSEKISTRTSSLVTLALLGYTVGVSRAWVKNTTDRVPLLTTWFATDEYRNLWERLFLSLGLVITLPDYSDDDFRLFVVSISASAAIGLGIALLGGASLLLFAAATLRITLVLSELYIRN